MSYFNTLLNSTTSRYASFRRTLLSSSSEDDSSVDDPESSHVSRVLRAYYIEKNRPFPPWLGTDPRAAPTPQQSFVGSAQGSLRAQNHSHPGSAAVGSTGGGLGDLWADNPTSGRAAEEPGSLRRGFRPRLGARGPEDPVQARQLPSQRAGSYQTQNPPYTAPLPSGARTLSPAPAPPSSAGSVQERLKARLGGRSSPATPPSPARDDRRAGSSSSSSAAAASSGDRATATQRPYVAAGSPWSGADDGSRGGGALGQGYDRGGQSGGGVGYGRGPASGGQRPRG